MATYKPSPSPWRVRRTRYGAGITREVEAANGAIVTGITTQMTHGILTEANARLIASAPEMLALLEHPYTESISWLDRRDAVLNYVKGDVYG